MFESKSEMPEETLVRPVEPLSYARGDGSPRVRLFAGALILVAGLALIGLGGCFLMGILSILMPNMLFGPSTPPKWTAGMYVLTTVLYACAFACLAASAWVLSAGIRGLLSVVRSS